MNHGNHLYPEESPADHDKGSGGDPSVPSSHDGTLSVSEGTRVTG